MSAENGFIQNRNQQMFEIFQLISYMRQKPAELIKLFKHS